MSTVKRWMVMTLAAGTILAATTVTTVIVFEMSEDSGSAQLPPAARRSSDLLLIEARDRLAICVKSVGVTQAIEDQVKITLEGALASLSTDPVWIQQGLSVPAPLVQMECEEQPALFDQSNAGTAVSFFDIEPRIVTIPSYYRVILFILPEEEIRRYSGDPPFYLSAEEATCSGDDCVQVTTGVYVSLQQLRDPLLIQDILSKAIGLEPPF